MRPSHMRAAGALALFAAALLAPAPASARDGDCQDHDALIFVDEVERENGYDLYAEVKTDAPITMTLDFSLTNMVRKSDRRVFVFRGRGRERVARLVVQNAAESWRYTYDANWRLGAPGARHDPDVTYRLPFREGDAFEVTQGYDGDYSHSGSVRFAVDWGAPIGTRIHAARGGVVIDVCETSDEGGPNEEYVDKGNGLTILHDDGTMSEYAHLRRDGVVPVIGQRVETGELIGYSGNTGWSTGPHLHFHVMRMARDGFRETIPTTFRTRRGASVTLVEGKTYVTVP